MSAMESMISASGLKTAALSGPPAAASRNPEAARRKKLLFKHAPDGGCLRGLFWAFVAEGFALAVVLLAAWGSEILHP